MKNSMLYVGAGGLSIVTAFWITFFKEILQLEDVEFEFLVIGTVVSVAAGLLCLWAWKEDRDFRKRIS